MDNFEKELARMMRDTQENTPFEPRHQDRLQAAVRVRRRTRTAWMASGSLLTMAGLAVGLLVLPNAFAQGQPAAPHHRPVPPASQPATTAPAPGPTATFMPAPGSSATLTPAPGPTATFMPAPGPTATLIRATTGPSLTPNTSHASGR